MKDMKMFRDRIVGLVENMAAVGIKAAMDLAPMDHWKPTIPWDAGSLAVTPAFI